VSKENSNQFQTIERSFNRRSNRTSCIPRL